jgi:O-acetylserine/cysteine efflux transporter
MPRRRALGCLLLLSVTMITLPLGLLFWARQHLPSATVTVLFALMPLVVILLTPGLEGRLVPNRATPAAIVGLGAITLATGASFSAAQAGGAAVVLVAVASTGASSLIARRELKGINPLVVTVFLMGPAALLLFAAGTVLERGQSFPWNRDAIVPVSLLATLGGALPYALYFWLLQKLEAYQLATLQWIQPLVALCETAIVLRMGFSYSMLVGSLVTLGSVLVVMRARVEDDDTVSLLGN